MFRFVLALGPGDSCRWAQETLCGRLWQLEGRPFLWKPWRVGLKLWHFSRWMGRNTIHTIHYYTLISLNKNEGNGRTLLHSKNPSLLSAQAQSLKWPPQLSTGKKASSSIFQHFSAPLLFFILFQVCDVFLGAILGPCFARQVMTAQYGGRSWATAGPSCCPPSLRWDMPGCISCRLGVGADHGNLGDMCQAIRKGWWMTSCE